METFFTESLGISETIFSYVLLPSLIFLARICDVSINTIRIIYVLGGRKVTATFLGFFESFIWLMAIRQIFEHLEKVNRASDDYVLATEPSSRGFVSWLRSIRRE